jgi:hypothetical protein
MRLGGGNGSVMPTGFLRHSHNKTHQPDHSERLQWFTRPGGEDHTAPACDFAGSFDTHGAKALVLNQPSPTISKVAVTRHAAWPISLGVPGALPLRASYPRLLARRAMTAVISTR